MERNGWDSGQPRFSREQNHANQYQDLWAVGLDRSGLQDELQKRLNQAKNKEMVDGIKQLRKQCPRI